MQDFRKLRVWQNAHQLAIDTYTLPRFFLKPEAWPLRDQILKSVISIPSNIAEGAGRVTRADKARAYAIARGELSEAVAAVEIAAETADTRSDSVVLVLEIGTELYAVLSKLIG